ncbi:hypothetical protein Bpfe_004484 [Biomphalaria pfeifferi]|uniref:Uncharacterized protein n=1 Tax=Biomphalaria pfeifferi TaxID=112525 RepID=A0AAD8FJN0_BIOPF|nr:hypothetical protein Bpfe_004484 [Biomphalaria pfeifferi]
MRGGGWRYLKCLYVFRDIMNNIIPSWTPGIRQCVSKCLIRVVLARDTLRLTTCYFVELLNLAVSLASSGAIQSMHIRATFLSNELATLREQLTFDVLSSGRSVSISLEDKNAAHEKMGHKTRRNSPPPWTHQQLIETHRPAKCPGNRL